MRIANDDFIQAGTLTDMNVEIESTPLWVGQVVSYSIQLTFINNPVGTFKLQYCNNDGNTQLAPTKFYADVDNFVDVVGSSQAITESGTHMWEVGNTAARWVRFVWTPTSGNGILIAARFQTKGV